MLAFLGPVGSIISWVLSPIGKYVAIASVILAIVAGIDIHARISQHHADQARIERQAADAVGKGQAARSAAQKKFDNGAYNAKPRGIISRWVRHGSDGFARD